MSNFDCKGCRDKQRKARAFIISTFMNLKCSCLNYLFVRVRNIRQGRESLNKSLVQTMEMKMREHIR